MSLSITPYSQPSHFIFKLSSSAFEHTLLSLTKTKQKTKKHVHLSLNPLLIWHHAIVLLSSHSNFLKTVYTLALFLQVLTIWYLISTPRKGLSPRYWQPTTLLLSLTHHNMVSAEHFLFEILSSFSSFDISLSPICSFIPSLPGQFLFFYPFV